MEKLFNRDIMKSSLRLDNEITIKDVKKTMPRLRFRTMSQKVHIDTPLSDAQKVGTILEGEMPLL
jgi:hypothetical protein